MKFTVSTKPLKAATDLAVIKENVTKYFQRSTLLQLTATKTDLIINTESDSIFSEVVLKGMGDGDDAVIFIDNMQFKKLLSTINTPQITLEFTANGIIVIAGKSTFALPKVMDADGFKLNSPEKIVDESSAVVIDKNGWKFIKEHQLFAKATLDQHNALGKAASTANPIYTYVWVGDSDVIVGDYVNSIFTHSGFSQLEKPCLLSECIINLFVSMPDGAKMVSLGESYVITVMSDSYEYTAQFKPLYESDDNGNYNASIIIDMMSADENNGVIVNGDEIVSALNQSLLLADSKTHNVQFTVSADGVRIRDSRVNCFVAPENTVEMDEYTLTFNPNVLKSVISACPEPLIKICPTIAEDEVVGILIIDKTMTVVLGGLEA